MRADRGYPTTLASDQRSEILRLLREAGPAGVSKAHLLFTRHFSQAAARVHELESMGCEIRHESRHGEQYVFFVLVREPENLKPLPKFEPRGTNQRQQVFSSSADWFEREHGPRPSSKPQEPVGDLPLFAFLGESK